MSSKTIYHYVYRITNLVECKHYYGTRSSKVHPTEDLGIEYFSSSLDKNFIKDQKDKPHNYKYKVIRLFDSRKEAIAFEIRLHEKFDVGVNYSFYNRAKQTSVGWDSQGNSFAKNKIWINKNGIEKMVDKKEFDNYIENGWVKGRESNLSGLLWVNNGDKQSKVRKEELENYLNNGWELGQNYSSTIGKRVIHKNNKNKFVDVYELDSFLNSGWSEGWSDSCKHGSNRNRVYINDGSRNKIVERDILDSFLNMGWILGKLTIVCEHCNENISAENINRHQKSCSKPKNKNEGKINTRFSGKKHNDETRKLFSEKRKGDSIYNNGQKEIRVNPGEDIPHGFTLGRLKFKCIHCGKEAIKTNINRHHNDNCKKKES